MRSRLDLAGPLSGRGLQMNAMPGGEVTAAERERLRGVVAAAELGVTGVDLAVAETGTLVVVSGAGRPRSTSLLPACHAAVFDRDVLVESLAQAGLVLEAWHEGSTADARGAAINFITGPSRTADIELTLTRGSARAQGSPRGVRRGRPRRGSAWLSVTSSAKRSSD